MPDLTIWEYLEDFDNAQLDHETWMEVLREKVDDYNKEFGTAYKPDNTVHQYINRQKEQDR